jgi:putative endonuclease
VSPAWVAVAEPPARFRPHDLGRRGEAAAADFLRSLGFRILERRLRSRAGEIDLVAAEGETLVFVEVKSRSGEGFGRPAEAVDRRKQARMTRAAAAYLVSLGGPDRACRFDVVEVVQSRGSVLRCTLIRDAFQG